MPNKRDNSNGHALFPIVGVGASAGGLEAFTELLKHLPLDTGMGFVLVQHLDPQHESALTQILARATAMPVSEVTQDLRVEPNRVYIIPPNTDLGIAEGVLKLKPREQKRTPHRSVDFFFESLAADQRERAIGVILSGTATDGTLGLEAIKAEAGITFAQDDSAKYDSMPQSAVAAGCVDFILSPENIASELARMAKHPYVAGKLFELLRPEEDRAEATEHEDDETPLPSGGKGTPPTKAEEVRREGENGEASSGQENGFKKILLLLRNHSGVDFTLYKSTTIQRRILRRLVLSKQETLEAYAEVLRGNAKELDALYSDVLISVTSFFRNPEAFDVLQQTVFPRLFEQPGDEPLRVWVLGCSTGQEAYSIAMAFTEVVAKAPRLRRLQVFATDLNDALLEKARHGLYAKSLAQDVSPERLRRFFVEEEGGYRVVKSLRELVVFARQNLINDPPFSRMDLISCRNLLIYLEPSLQKKALPTFHYALKPDGFLFLGASESIGGFTELFEPADKKNKIFSKKPAPAPTFHLPVRAERSGKASFGSHLPSLLPIAERQAGISEGFRSELNAQHEADRISVAQFAPPGVLINAELQILQFRGATSAYLQPPTGKASFDVLKMAREGLMLPLRAAIKKAKKENKTVRHENVRVEQDGDSRTVNLEVIPLKNVRECCFLVLFENAGKAKRTDVSPPPEKPPEAGGKTKAAGRANSQESRRRSELEAELLETREYLQFIQEQNEASNEELQASNEEVQSSNEELQSVNEELETSKEELESTNEELTTVNEEMANRNAELNRLNSDLVNLQNTTHLAIMLLGRDLTIRRFSAQAEKQFNLNASDIGRPIGNVRLNLFFADSLNSGREVSRASEARERRGTAWEDTRSLTGESQERALQAPPDLEAFILEAIASVRDGERGVQDREGHWYSLRVRPYLTLDNKVDGAVLVLVDIDAVKRNERIQGALDFAENLVDTVREPLLVLDGSLRVRSAGRAFYRDFQVTPEETVGQFIYELGNGEWNIPKLRTLLEKILPENTSFDDFEVDHEFKHLGQRKMLLNARRLDDQVGRSQWILLAIEDITERRQHEEKLERARLIEAALATARDPLVILGADLCILTANEAFYRTFKVSAVESEGRSIIDVGNGQWKIPKLRALLGDVLPRNSFFDDFEVDHDFKGLGRRTMLLNARALNDGSGQPTRILLGIQDITERLLYQADMRRSEQRYRRLFEAAKDGILILDPVTRRIVDANPFMTELLGYQPDEFIGKELWQIGLIQSESSSHAAFRALQTEGSVRYESLSVDTPKASPRVVDMLCNLYPEDGEHVIQCNIRDITERKQAEEAVGQSHAQLRLHAEELDRFNRVAVGRELRMIALKKEINELRQGKGEAEPYPLDFEPEDKETDG